MKKRFYLFLIVLLAILLVSCSPETGSESEIHTGEVAPIPIDDENYPQQAGDSSEPVRGWIRYEDVSIEISLEPSYEELSFDAQHYFYVFGQTMTRFNKVTGEASAVCPDPLCEHKDLNCDFYSSGARQLYSVIDNTIYYFRNLYDNVNFHYDELWKYDIKNQKASKLYRCTGMDLSSVISVSSGCYFTEESSYVSESNQNKRIYTTNLYFVDLNGTVTKLLSMDGNFRISSVEDGKLWWYENDGGFYVSDPYGKEFSAYNTTTRRPKRENYAFYMRSSGISNGKSLNALYRTDLDTGEEVQLLDSCAFYTIHGDRIYYLEYLKESIVIGPVANGSGNYTDAFGGKLYSMDFNGEDKKLVVDDENVHFMNLPAVRNSPHMDDRYMGILLTHYEEVTTGKRGLISYAWRSMLVYDAETGEYRIGLYEP